MSRVHGIVFDANLPSVGGYGIYFLDEIFLRSAETNILEPYSDDYGQLICDAYSILTAYL